jgi:hypothetical protein
MHLLSRLFKINTMETSKDSFNNIIIRINQITMGGGIFNAADLNLIHGTTMLNNRFLFLRQLGHGISGIVLLAMDTMARKQVALKVYAHDHTVAGELEESILQSVATRDPYHHVPIVKYIMSFHHHGYLCIVLELLGPSLFSYRMPQATKMITNNVDNSDDDDGSSGNAPMKLVAAHVRRRAPWLCSAARPHGDISRLRRMVRLKRLSRMQS